MRRACGTARYAYNWALAEWKRMYAAGEKPTTMKVKARFNAHKKAECPWAYEVTKCAAEGAVFDLGAAYKNFFNYIAKKKAGVKSRKVGYPKFKKKRLDESFDLANDKFTLDGSSIDIPKLGSVRMREPLRFQGKIMGASVSRQGGRWFVSIQVNDGVNAPAPVDKGVVVGVDLGLNDRIVLSTGEKIDLPRPRRALLKRQKRLQRRLSLQRHRAKAASQRQLRRQYRLSRLHARMANIRKDSIHKATTALTRRFDAIVVEDLNVAGMVKNHSLAGSILDACFSEIRRQIGYKMTMRGGRVVVAGRFFPSTQTCSDCEKKAETPISLDARSWTCEHCGVLHDRDVNAARNLERLGLATLAGESRGGAHWRGASERARSNARGDDASLAAKRSLKASSANREINPLLTCEYV